MTQETSRMISLPRYNIERRISVVITMQDADGLIVTSPVISPTSWKISYSSRYF
jgi:Ni,Fe-hydrogenase III small subunit